MRSCLTFSGAESHDIPSAIETFLLKVQRMYVQLDQTKAGGVQGLEWAHQLSAVISSQFLDSVQ